MAGRGPAPKAERSRPNDTARRQAEMTHVAEDGELRGPDLPEGLAWHERTRAWWDTWRRSPQAQTFTATDWDFLLDTAMLHSELWSGNAGVAAELRLRASKFGATPEDRLRLKLQIDTDAEAAPKQKAGNTARRARLLSVVGDA